MARKSKYDTIIVPKMDDIKLWVSKGFTDREIIKRLGISASTWYKHKSEFVEFSDTINICREPNIRDLEKTCFEIAKGFKTEITEAVKCKNVYYDKQNRRCEKEEIKIISINKYFPPDFRALKFLLINWSDKYSNDPAIIKQREKEFEHKKEIDEKNMW